MSPPRVLVLAKKSALRVHQESTDPERHARIEELLRIGDPTVARVRLAHGKHEATLAEVSEALDKLGCDAELLSATALDSFRLAIERVAPNTPDLVVTVGGDGTLLAASHYVGSTPVLSINSSPSTSVGFFSAARLGEVRSWLERALANELPRILLTRMQVERNAVVLARRILNEVLFCAASPAATSRYIFEHRGVHEDQKSSGIWIGPAAGSTAAQRSAGGRVLALGSTKLQFVVREPYTPPGQAMKLPRGLCRSDETLRVRSKMSDGRLYIDGPHEVHVVEHGDVLTFAVGNEPLTLLGIVRRRAVRPSQTAAALT